MPQRITRLEEEVHELWQSIVGLRGVVDRWITNQSRFATWMISCMTQLMDASGRTYQAFENTLIGSSHIPYQRRTRRRTSDASTFLAPQQLTLDLFRLLIDCYLIFCGHVLYIIIMMRINFICFLIYMMI
nr:hypothetical protein [Tanacetum cinerariifolium]